jgi:hypothetical protein
MKSLPNHPPDIRDLRFQRNVDRLPELGSRVLYEMLIELGRRTMHMTTIEQVVERFAAIDPNTLRDLRGDRFPTRPLRAVGGRHASR